MNAIDWEDGIIDCAMFQVRYRRLVAGVSARTWNRRISSLRIAT